MTMSPFHRKFLLFIVFVGSFFLFSCTTNDPVLDDTLIPDESMFVLTIFEPAESYAVGESVVVSATFKNISKTAFVVKHGAPFPLIALENESIVVNSILIHETIRGLREIHIDRTFVFQEPGMVKVVVTAEFTILSKQYSYSEEVHIHVE